MADLMVTMGIDDRGVRQGIRRAEDTVHRSQNRMNSAFDSNVLVSQKAVGKIASELTGMSLKYGALGGAFLAFRSGAEYLREFESQLPKAERGLERLTEVSNQFKQSWAIGTEMLIGGLSGGINGGGLLSEYNSMINAVGDWLKPKTRTNSEPLFGKGSPLEFLNGSDAAPLSEGTSAEADAAYRDDLKRIAAGRLKEQSLAKQKALEAEILGLQGKQYEAEMARLEAARLFEYIKIKEKADSGMPIEDVAAEKEAVRAREKAGMEKARRDEESKAIAKAHEEESERERKAQEEARKAQEIIHKREDAQVDIYEAKARLRNAKATTDEEKKSAEEARAYAKYKREELAIKRQGLDADQENELSLYNQAEYEATIEAIRARQDDKPKSRPQAPDGLDLSSAGAFASQGQAMAFQIPGKIDRTNVLLQQSGQTLQRIEQKLDSTARFAP